MSSGTRGDTLQRAFGSTYLQLSWYLRLSKTWPDDPRASCVTIQSGNSSSSSAKVVTGSNRILLPGLNEQSRTFSTYLTHWRRASAHQQFRRLSMLGRSADSERFWVLLSLNATECTSLSTTSIRLGTVRLMLRSLLACYWLSFPAWTLSAKKLKRRFDRMEL